MMVIVHCITGSLLLISSFLLSALLCFSLTLISILVILIAPRSSDAFVLPCVRTCYNYLKPFICGRRYSLMTSHFKSFPYNDFGLEEVTVCKYNDPDMLL